MFIEVSWSYMIQAWLEFFFLRIKLEKTSTTEMSVESFDENLNFLSDSNTSI